MPTKKEYPMECYACEYKTNQLFMVLINMKATKQHKWIIDIQ